MSHRPRLRLAPLGLIALLIAPALDGPEGGDPGAARRPSERALEWLGEERDRFAEDLESAHGALLERARAEAPELVELLSPEPPEPAKPGYGVLPEVRHSAPERRIEPRERRYSLESLTTGFAPAIRDAALLAGRVADEPDAPLESLVRDFERLRTDLRNLEEHLSYHEFWQRAVVENAEEYAERRATLELVREWHGLVRSGAEPERRRELRERLRERLRPFEATAGLALERAEDGARVLAVPVATDVAGAGFLGTFEAAVAEAFAESPAARERGFRVELQWRRLDVAELYPGGPPAADAAVDLEDHLGRCPEGALVLTTGAESTHAKVGRYVMLGPQPLSERELAHEFGHLLGFQDAYLRASEGDPEGPFGCVLVEWTGLFDDLMGDSRQGRVTGELIDRLIDAYGGD